MTTSKGGRPPFKPTDAQRKQVEAMAAYGVPEEDIARVVDISPHTLRKYFRDELDTAHAKANASVAESLFKQAKSGNVTAQIFWLKCRAGWKDRQLVELSGSVEGLSDEERAARVQALLERVNQRSGGGS